VSPRAIDRNVVLRYVLQDDLDQWEKATRLIDSEEPLGMTAVTLAEIAWTLGGPRYHRERSAVAMLLVDLLARENIVAVGFGDALIAACARSAGLQEIYSFDQRFARAGLAPVPPP
jgi:predicted nucleic acid-binding protein